MLENNYGPIMPILQATITAHEATTACSPDKVGGSAGVQLRLC